MTKYNLSKMTPYKTKDWYIKWGASIVLIVGIILTSNNIYPLNLYFDIVGLSGWFVVGMIWNDRALIVINVVSLAILINGLVTYYVK